MSVTSSTTSGFPFDYQKDLLFDEIKFKALNQRLGRFQKGNISDPADQAMIAAFIANAPKEIEKLNAALASATPTQAKEINSRIHLLKTPTPKAELLALETSKKIYQTLNEADIKRSALFTQSSINKSFGLPAQLAKRGFFGKLISLLLNQ